jgi:dihydroorotase
MLIADFDLLIRAKRVICPRNNIDACVEIAVRGDRIVAVGDNIEGTAARVLDFSEQILVPGLIDMHAHPAKTGSVFGVDPDRFMLQRGVTTVLSQGDAGASNLQQYVESTIEASNTRVLLAINLSRIGESTAAGCLERLSDADVNACINAIEQGGGHIWGIAINASHNACGSADPREVVRRGRLVADQTGLPILYGMRRPEDWPFDEQMRLLRSGDVVTYCFRRKPHCIAEEGRVHSAIRDARQRGILFDLGHGTASFDFEVAEQAIDNGFPPDTISTDLQLRHIGCEPQHDLPLVLSKLHAAGMSETDVFAAATSTPAKILGKANEIGSLTVGACADLTILTWNDRHRALTDCHGSERQSGRWTTQMTVRAGEVCDGGDNVSRTR